MQSDSSVALRLRMTPFQGFSGLDQVRSARQKIEAAQWREGAVLRDVKREVENLLVSAEMLQAREENLAKQVTNAADLTQLYQEQFMVGRRDIVDLFTIERERVDAERQLNDLRIQRIRVQYRAASKLGLLDDLIEQGGVLR